MLEAAVGSAGLDALMDAVLSIDEVGIYKPHKRAYQLAVDRLALPADRICFISTNGWDVAGAAVFGFRVVWHNRFGRPQDRLPGEPEAVITSLDELPGLLGG
jgi:2-haloacid dehalogenase